MMESPLGEYIKFLYREGIKMDEFHWKPTKRGENRQLWAMEKMLKAEGILTDDYSLRKICNVRGCLNPFHYRLVPELRKLPDPQEVAELIEMVDVETCINLGFEAYLTLFNDGNPLPAKEEDMRAAVAIAFAKAGKGDKLKW